MKKTVQKICFIVPFLVFFSSVFAQSETTTKSKKETGYFNLTSIGLVLGTPNDFFKVNTVVPSLTMVNGYSFNEHFSAGIGVGAEMYQYSIFPLFADLRYKLPQSGYSSFIALKGGYAFAESKKSMVDEEDTYYYYSTHDKFSNTGGWMFNPEVGVSFSIVPKVDVVVSLGYRFQQLHSEVTRYYYSTPTGVVDNITTTFNRLSFNVGFSFH